MTEHTKRFIEMVDIVGLRFECAHEGCGASLALPLKPEIIKDETLTKCPSCGREWALENKSGGRGFDSRAVFKSLVKAIDEVHKARSGFSFSLELKTPPASVSDTSKAS
jgi:hypothetical protein